MSNNTPATSSKTSKFNGSKQARRRKRKVIAYRPVKLISVKAYERLKAAGL